MSSRKPEKNEKVLLFNVTFKNDPKVWREVEILGEQTLYQFAEAIVSAFGFDFDHCFGFYSKWEGKFVNYYHSKEIYELFTDLPDVEHTPGAKGVEKVQVVQAFLRKDKKMLFLFDYGDDWEFIVHLKEIKTRGKVSYPRIVKEKGQAPEQYPPLKEES